MRSNHAASGRTMESYKVRPSSLMVNASVASNARSTLTAAWGCSKAMYLLSVMVGTQEANRSKQKPGHQNAANIPNILNKHQQHWLLKKYQKEVWNKWKHLMLKVSKMKALDAVYFEKIKQCVLKIWLKMKAIWCKLLKWAYVFHILVLKKYLKLNQYCSIKFWIVWISN